MGKVRMGIIGCGWAGNRHAEAIQKLSTKISLISACDIDPKRAKSFAGTYNINFCSTNYLEILNNKMIDAVSICLPHNLHAKISIKAAQSGLHILIEKPLCTTLEDSIEMINAAEESRIIFMVAEPVRYRKLPQKVAELLNSNKIGIPFMFRISRESDMHSELIDKPWLLEDHSGGIMFSAGIHEFDFLRQIAGEPEHIYALETKKTIKEMPGDETSVAMVKMKSGAVAIVVESFSIKTQPSGVSGIIHGEKGTLKFAQNVISIYTPEEKEQTEKIVVNEINGFVAEIEDFADCIRSDKEPISSSQEGKKSLACILAVYKSMKAGQPVYVTEQ